MQIYSHISDMTKSRAVDETAERVDFKLMKDRGELYPWPMHFGIEEDEEVLFGTGNRSRHYTLLVLTGA